MEWMRLHATLETAQAREKAIGINMHNLRKVIEIFTFVATLDDFALGQGILQIRERPTHLPCDCEYDTIGLLSLERLRILGGNLMENGMVRNHPQPVSISFKGSIDDFALRVTPRAIRQLLGAIERFLDD